MTINNPHITVGIALLLLTACQSTGGEKRPEITRTGQVRDIVISESLSPATVSVKPGDEIRWINKRQGAAEVIFLSPVMDMLSCERNFGSLIKQTNRQQYAASLNPNDSASVCFTGAADVAYVIRAPSQTEPSGDMNLQGKIHVLGANTEEPQALAKERSSPQSSEEQGPRSKNR
jgi:plastocyanin